MFVKELHEKLLQRDGFEKVNVQHNVTLIGKSKATHQIDVSWKIKLAGIEQLFCIECKRWKSKVKKSDISSFITNLSDLGNARGIYVTTEGYQKGAVLLAKQNGIILIKANPSITRIPATMEILFPQTSHINITFEEELSKVNLEKLNQWIINNSDNANASFFDSMGIYRCNFGELISSLEKEKSGYYKEILDNIYIKAGNKIIRCDEIRYYFVINTGPSFTLNGYSEAAEIIAQYIETNEEVKFFLDQYEIN
jgi:hypothetical protein